MSRGYINRKKSLRNLLRLYPDHDQKQQVKQQWLADSHLPVPHWFFLMFFPPPKARRPFVLILERTVWDWFKELWGKWFDRT